MRTQTEMPRRETWAPFSAVAPASAARGEAACPDTPSGVLTILRPLIGSSNQNGPLVATKTIDAQCNKLRGYNAGYRFAVREVPYSSGDYHEKMRALLLEQEEFLILGRLNDNGRRLSRRSKIRRLKHDKDDAKATLHPEASGREIVLDLDDADLPGFDPFAPEATVLRVMEDIGCAGVQVTWQVTSGQKTAPGSLARIRLYFLIDTDHTLAQRKRWAAQLPRHLCVDGAVFVVTQPIYTAPPIVEGGDDPFICRSGTIPGHPAATIVIPEEPAYNAPVGVDSGYIPADTPALSVIGDHDGGRGVHRGIRDAIFALVAREGDELSDGDIVSAICGAVASAQFSAGREKSYLDAETDPDKLRGSIRGARERVSKVASTLVGIESGYSWSEEQPQIDASARVVEIINQFRLGDAMRCIIAMPGLGKTNEVVHGYVDPPRVI